MTFNPFLHDNSGNPKLGFQVNIVVPPLNGG